jgi:competence protein ComEC
MRTTFYVLIGGLLSGVLVRSITPIGQTTLIALFVGAVSVFGLHALIGRKTFFPYVTLFVLVMVLGVLRTEMAFLEHERGYLFEAGTYIERIGFVKREPDNRDTYTILYVTLFETVELDETNVRIKVPSNPTYTYGEVLRVSGTVDVPESFQTETGRVFNYHGYLMKDGIQYELKDATVVSEGTRAGNMITARLLSIKHAWLDTISLLIPEPASSLAGGIIVGAKQSLGERWLELFRTTGIIHIVVLSGYNLTLVANSIIRSTARLPQVIRFTLGSVGIALFAVMVGGGATVVRASVMAFLGMLAGAIQRNYILLRALLFAGAMMVLWNPFVLLFDTGFQLSFIATAGLILLSPHIEKKLSFIPEKAGLRGIVAATIATQVAVLPLLLYHIGTISLVAPLVNILILPFVPFVMLTGFLSGAIGLLSPTLALPLAYITHGVLSYLFFVVYLFSLFPFSAVTLPLVHWSVILLFYVFGGVLLYRYQKPPALTQAVL